MIIGGIMGKIIKDTLHANGIDIGIYTQDFWDYGKDYIIQILNPSNSRGLKSRLVPMHLQCHRKNG